jgi:alkylation response protein AidB-like acyl-CoA dehydrogenase
LIRSSTPVTAPGVAIGAAMKQPRETANTHGPVTPQAAVSSSWLLGRQGRSELRSAIQIFGARGYTREYGLEKGLRDAVGAPIYPHKP